MNTLIQELAEQCYNLPNTPEALYYRKFDEQKFAELIIRECAGIDFRREVGLGSQDDLEISKVIKQHFGLLP